MRARRGTALSAVGVALLSVLAWRRLTGDPGHVLLSALVTVGVLAAAVAVAALAARYEARVRRTARRARPTWSAWAVRADPTLHEELRREGWYVQRTGGLLPRLTLAWSAAGLELWRGDDVLVPLPWEAVAAVTATTGRVGGRVRPALCVTTHGDARLVLVPSSRQDGALGWASAAAVDALVDRVRAARDG